MAGKRVGDQRSGEDSPLTSHRARVLVLRFNWNRTRVEAVIVAKRPVALRDMTLAAGGQAVMTTESMFSTSTVMVRVTSARTPARSAASSR